MASATATKGLDPLTNDTYQDNDMGGFSNLVEFTAGTAANDPNETPENAKATLRLLPLILDTD